MPSEYIAAALGLVVAGVAAVPLWFANRLTMNRERRVGYYTMLAVLAAQGISMVVVTIAIIICFAMAKQLLLWLALPAISTLLLLNVVMAFWIIRSRRRR
ncbi:MAG: hypothetical protein FWD45_01945 [Coriobacteriia bacterium]|nr:hypothetical protein [Coriobacteriia bacterium]